MQQNIESILSFFILFILILLVIALFWPKRKKPKPTEQFFIYLVNYLKLLHMEIIELADKHYVTVEKTQDDENGYIVVYRYLESFLARLVVRFNENEVRLSLTVRRGDEENPFIREYIKLFNDRGQQFQKETGISLELTKSRNVCYCLWQ